MNHTNIVNLWDCADELMAAINIYLPKGLRIKHRQTIYRWRERNSIPAVYWKAIVDASLKTDHPITLEMLADSKKRQRRKPS